MLKKMNLLLTGLIIATIVGLSTSAQTTQTQKNAIVRLHMLAGGFVCSGFVVSDTEVITAAHCVFGMGPLVVKSSDEEVSAMVEATLVSPDSRDLAILQGDFRKFGKLKTDESTTGDPVGQGLTEMKACGYPYGMELVCYNLTEIQKRGFTTSARGQVYPGMSGGPVMHGDVAYGANHAMSLIDHVVFFQPLIGFRTMLRQYNGE